MIRSWRFRSSLLLAAIGAVGCATGAAPDTYTGTGDDGVSAVGEEAGPRSGAGAEAAAAESGGGGRVPDATAQDTGSGVDVSQPDVAAVGDAPSSADAGQDTSMPEASADVTESDDSGDDADIDGGAMPEAGSGSDSGAVCNRHTCSGCCDTNDVCHTKPSASNCPTSFQSGAACEDCKAEGEDYCVLDLIVYVCSSTP